MSRGVNMVPMVAPAMMFLIVLYFIPLQMITLHEDKIKPVWSTVQVYCPLPTAVVQGEAGAPDLGLHATGPDQGLLAKLEVVDVLRVEVGEELGALLLGRPVVDPVHVRHQDGEVSVDIHSDPAGQTVIVSDVQSALSVNK